jgi:acyl-CoA synthetase (AMP-forming)/AMP-acid ligase II
MSALPLTAWAVDRTGEHVTGHTLAELVRLRALHEPERLAYRFFKGPALEPTTLTFGHLWARSASLARHLHELDLGARSVLLVCKSQPNFVVAFFACLIAGVVAVPTAVPRRQNLHQRLQLLAQDADVRAVLSDAPEVDGLALEGRSLPRIALGTWNAEPDAQHLADVSDRALPAVPRDALAFLQYTSGSTGDPKGVMVTHANLMHNCAEIRQAMGFTRESSIFTALPLFHDMGLVGGVLESMFAGCVGNCMAPTEFVQYPERWLQILSKFRVTITGGPNFMFDLAQRNVQPEHLAGVDLSCVEVAFCGAEPIRAATMERFIRKFAAWGLAPTAFHPCYGMAEATLFVAGKTLATLPAVAQTTGGRVVSCGVSEGESRVLVVDPETRLETRDGTTGEIWVRGPSVAAGYRGRPDLSARTFHATLQGQSEPRHLRTGDLGFLRDGQLHVCGRLKDLIIVNGRKYAPQDLEEAAGAAHAALQDGAAAAFCLHEDGQDRVIVACELRREWLRRADQWPEVAAALRSAVIAEQDVRIDDVVLLRPGTLPRTSSGKVRRAQCCADYRTQSLADVRRAGAPA